MLWTILVILVILWLLGFCPQDWRRFDSPDPGDRGDSANRPTDYRTARLN
jgi:hypothetical protein